MILVNEPVIGEKEKKLVQDCLETGWISSSGTYIESFEQSWARYCGVEHGIAVSNGTAALEIAVACLDLNPGDEVILPSFTIISCIQAITYNKLVPVLVDCDPLTWCMAVSEIEEKITPRTRAIMPVHMYGHPVDMDPLIELARRYNLKIIEDAAEVHGGEYKGRKCGSMGDISTFSFFANKIITTGEGGMILTNDSSYAEKARKIRNLCFEPGRRFVHQNLGFNYRMTNLQAAIGCAQVERIDELVQKKIAIGEYYLDQLRDVAGIQLPVQMSWAKNVYWMFGFVIDEKTGESAESFATKMKSLGIETRPFFLGMHEQPYFKDKGYFLGELYPVTELISRQGLYIPSGLNLSFEMQDIVVQNVRKILLDKR
jgi:perosamine synthetase